MPMLIRFYIVFEGEEDNKLLEYYFVGSFYKHILFKDMESYVQVLHQQCQLVKRALAAS